MLCETKAHYPPAMRCLLLQCDDCGPAKLQQYLKVNNTDELICWSKWMADDTKRTKVVKRSASLQECINEFVEDMKTFPLHLFRARWQHKEFVDAKTNPGLETVVSVMDFAENYRCVLQDEIQSAHWSYSQVTLHPVVHYYLCHDCNKVITDVTAIISDDLTHDTQAVLLYSDLAYQHLAQKGYYFRRLMQWTDGCGAPQYKCKDACRDLEVLKERCTANEVERHLFGSRHGKNACDGESAVIKRTVTQALKSRRVVIQNAQISLLSAKHTW
ncbi:Cc8l18.2-like protein [Plakobranchus ocellatus]|uniref:Cc8l18.2-like protein n=1 Tax=Plakobranchus ocellatus TaxID=259542 RepID=A0AAV4DTS2_9GAST|nr:Cc8l18.2-like protein [Plakobranchus ocellatus]